MSEKYLSRTPFRNSGHRDTNRVNNLGLPGVFEHSVNGCREEENHDREWALAIRRQQRKETAMWLFIFALFLVVCAGFFFLCLKLALR